ncbi:MULTISPECIES: biotin transporter BioY [Clostridium]|uniref:biotin transporter BioY n=1 Tax=Clostridium TaxID=1485 RepID=UPI00069E6577|nr:MULTISPECIES: biotin transporter BioY [Clostridium]KOF56679.1 biotin biosynthesis protein BioY [Clostridium sp. DMHC 10]MCD2346695.1 biotin transporter BioY [Clostridium guangxiense]
MQSKQTSVIQSKITTKQMILCSIFTALIIAGTFIRIPIPVLPFTLQFLFTMLAGLLLGPRLGTLSVFIYILIGFIGVPVFTDGGGLGYIFKPTFGYIIGFLVATYVTGKIANKVHNPTYKTILAANFVGLVIVYSLGMIYYYVICNFVINTPLGLWPLFLYCFVLAVPGDISLCIISAFLYKRLNPVIKHLE